MLNEIHIFDHKFVQARWTSIQFVETYHRLRTPLNHPNISTIKSSSNEIPEALNRSIKHSANRPNHEPLQSADEVDFRSILLVDSPSFLPRSTNPILENPIIGNVPSIVSNTTVAACLLENDAPFQGIECRTRFD